MKTRMILAAMLLLAFGGVKAQEKPIPTPGGDASKINTLVVSGTGSVYLKQGDKLTINDYGHNTAKYRVEDSILYLEGTGARDVTLQNLAYLKVSEANGQICIEVTTDAFAKDVQIYCTNGMGNFSDNFFDLEAGQTKRIVFIPNEKQEKFNFSVRCL